MDFVCDELVARDRCMNYNLVADLQVFQCGRCAALFKRRLVIHLYCYGFFGRGFDRNGTIGNAGDRAYDMLFFSMGKMPL